MVLRGHMVHWIPLDEPKYRLQGVKIHPTILLKQSSAWNKFTWPVIRFFQVKKILRVIAPDLVHAINVKWAGWYATFASIAPVVLSTQGQDVMRAQNCDSDYIRSKLRKKTLESAAVVTYGSGPMLEDILHWSSPKHTLRYFAGVDFSKFDYSLDLKGFRSQLDFKGKIVIFSPRMFTENSNLEVLVKALPLVNQKVKNVVILFARHLELDAYSNKLKNLIAELGVQDQCYFHGNITPEQMPYYYGVSDLVVSILSSDGMPATVLEAIAMKKPLLLTEIPTYLELKKNVPSIEFCEPQNERSTAEALIRMLTKNPQNEVQDAYQWARENAGMQNMNDKLEALYQKVLKE